MRKPDQIRPIIRDYIYQQFPAAADQQIGDSEPLLDRGIVDSLGVLDIVAFLEGEFAVSISDEALEPEDFESINALTSFVNRLLSDPSSSCSSSECASSG